MTSAEEEIEFIQVPEPENLCSDQMDLCEFLTKIREKKFTNSGKINLDRLAELRRRRDRAIFGLVSEIAVENAEPLPSQSWKPNIHTASHEATNLLLGDQHHRSGARLPKCLQGENCVVRDIDNTFAFGPLSISLSPSEREQWLQSGKVPADGNSRMCVLCSRFNTEAFWRIAESTNAAAGPCCPPFVNLSDTPDGYQSQFMIGPASGVHTLSAAIVRHVPHLLTISRGPNGRMYVDESKIRFGCPAYQSN